MTSYVCSECGFATGSPRAVAEHIQVAHEGAGRIMEDTTDQHGTDSRLHRALEGIIRLYDQMRRYHRRVRRRRFGGP